ncbi:hypothetical protein [Streptomyces griseus]|uniref:hypothetical protein n=1 Tax=Streptomyces griseus TaxID=1911 RepID=UPI00055F5C0E|nr:hypothetical protein [Streptomyces griseus]
MNAFLTAAAFVVLIAAAAYVIHRLNFQHADRIAAYRYSTPRPGRRGRTTHHGRSSESPHRPPGRASEPSAQSAATRVHPGPGPGGERPGPVDRGI